MRFRQFFVHSKIFRRGANSQQNKPKARPCESRSDRSFELGELSAYRCDSARCYSSSLSADASHKQ